MSLLGTLLGQGGTQGSALSMLQQYLSQGNQQQQQNQPVQGPVNTSQGGDGSNNPYGGVPQGVPQTDPNAQGQNSLGQAQQGANQLMIANQAAGQQQGGSGGGVGASALLSLL